MVQHRFNILLLVLVVAVVKLSVAVAAEEILYSEQQV
jgi:hypothetical protein